MSGRYISTLPHALMMHHFHDAVHPHGQGAISADDLDRMIRFVGRDRILPAEEWLERAVDGRLTPDDLCFSFDDALRCQYDVALPVLEAHGITAFWFVYSSVFEGILRKMEVYRYFRTVAFPNVEEFYLAFDAALDLAPFAARVRAAMADFDPARYLAEYSFYTDGDRRFRFLRDRILSHEEFESTMDALVNASGIDTQSLPRLLWMDEDCLRHLAGTGHAIGLHSYIHYTTLGDMSVEEQRREYVRNHRHLQGVTGRAPRSMAHPCNSYNADTLEVLRELGIQIGFRSNMVPVANSPFELPRQDHAIIMQQMDGR